MKLARLGGILVHPTSFPSPYGIGDLGQGAYDFVDFAHASGAKLWQVLPLGPTSFGDSPYQSFSTFAGNPLLISPDELVQEGLLSHTDTVDYPNFAPNTVDYGAVIPEKAALYKKAYHNLHTKDFPQEMADFKRFCEENSYWLEDYVLFIALKEYFIEKRRFDYESPEYKEYYKKNSQMLSDNAIKDNFYGAVWTSWPEDIKNRKPSTLAHWQDKLADELNEHRFLQYIFFKQWLALKNYANSLDIQIIGDIPIFVAMDSADVWGNPSLFMLDEDCTPTFVAGVPPDYFSETGQLWGNPLYDWPTHKATGYAWWCKRIEATLQMVDTLRIDHFRGFEAYWAVPYGDDTAVNGKWRKGPGDDLFRHVQAYFPGIDLPIIAEDLGVITPGVEALRDGLGFPGMRILQFGFEGKPSDPYLPHNFNTVDTVAYTGTHDNDTTTGWYAKADPKIQDYFRRVLNVSGEDPAWDLIRALIASSAAYAIVPIQDMMGLNSEYRMNMPGTASGNWQFRYTQEMLASNLSERLHYLITLFNRLDEEKEAVKTIDIEE